MSLIISLTARSKVSYMYRTLVCQMFTACQKEVSRLLKLEMEKIQSKIQGMKEEQETHSHELQQSEKKLPHEDKEKIELKALVLEETLHKEIHVAIQSTPNNLPNQDDQADEKV